MAKTQIAITDGPLKPDLQWAVAYPDKRLHIHFETDADPIDVHVDRMEELGDGSSFGLIGRIVSTNYKNRRFKAVYRLEDRTGTIEVLDE